MDKRNNQKSDRLDCDIQWGSSSRTEGKMLKFSLSFAIGYVRQILQAHHFVEAIINVGTDLEWNWALLFKGAAYSQHFLKPKRATAWYTFGNTEAFCISHCPLQSRRYLKLAHVWHSRNALCILFFHHSPFFLRRKHRWVSHSLMLSDIIAFATFSYWTELMGNSCTFFMDYKMHSFSV